MRVDIDDCEVMGCDGTRYFLVSEHCSCHVYAPCSHCEEKPLICDTCGARSDDLQEQETGHD